MSLILPAITLNGKVVLPNTELKTDVIITKEQSAILKAMEDDRMICLLLRERSDKEFESVGLIAKVIYQMEHASILKVKLNILKRCTINKIEDNENYFIADVEELSSTTDNEEIDRSLREKITNYMEDNSGSFISNPEDAQMFVRVKALESADAFADLLASKCKLPYAKLMEYVKTSSITLRLKQLYVDLHLVLEFAKYDSELEQDVTKQMQDAQKKYYLNEKRRAIARELGEDEDTDDFATISEKIEKSNMPDHVKNQARKELKKLKSMGMAQAESAVSRNYLDFLLSVPYTETKDQDDLAKAKAILDEDHYGLDKVKDRILEYLAAKMMSGKTPQSIICLAGPAGVGKTSIAKSIARALDKKFVKQSLGGVRDESEMRGHRRTYIGAMPGRIMAGMVKAGSCNPVYLLDEVDKLSSDYKGDPSSALLEVLDPEQNKIFQDHYMDLEYDLSKVFFICTANYLENVPAPLRDRMEIIEMSSYTSFEKLEIAKRHLIAKQLTLHGLDANLFTITDDAINIIIRDYTREAGVRELERYIGTLVRKTMKKIMLHEIERMDVTKDNLEALIGKPKFMGNNLPKTDLVGVVNGLAYTDAGGDTLQIEATTFHGDGKLNLTGSLGDVMKESCEIALGYIKSNATEFGIDSTIFDETDIHVHFPEGATPKDGPSAGVAIALAIVSALTKRCVDHTVAMTGEITLTGNVLPIGGLREKSIAASRDGITTIYIPKDNEVDLDEVPSSVKEILKINLATKASDVINACLTK